MSRVALGDEVARQLAEVAGRGVRYADVPAGAFEAGLREAGVDDWTAAALSELHQVYRAHHTEALTDGVQQVLGRPAHTFASWAAAHRAAFAG